jgi:hypothetical protein
VFLYTFSKISGVNPKIGITILAKKNHDTKKEAAHFISMIQPLFLYEQVWDSKRMHPPLWKYALEGLI